jgi:hypothetical protein
MQLVLSSTRSLDPILYPLFLGGVTPRCYMTTPLTGLSFGKSVGMTGSSSAPLPPPAAGLSLPAPRVVSYSSAGPTLSSAVSTRLDSSPVSSGPRTPCSRALVAGSADLVGPSMAGTPSVPPSNTPFYSPPPASSDVCAPGPFLCSCGSTIDADESPFHCLDCSGSQFFNIHRHHAVRDTTIIDLLNAVSSTHTSILSVLPKEPLVLPPADNTSVTDLCDEAQGNNTTLQIGPRQSVSDFCTSRAFARNPGLTRADCGFITSTNRRYIDMTVSNPAAPTYLPRPVLDPHGIPILPTAGVSWVQQIRTASKVARYRPILGPGASCHLPRGSHQTPSRSCDEAGQDHRPRLAKPDHPQPLLYPDRWGHCAIQRNGMRGCTIISALPTSRWGRRRGNSAPRMLLCIQYMIFVCN